MKCTCLRGIMCSTICFVVLGLWTKSSAQGASISRIAREAVEAALERRSREISKIGKEAFDKGADSLRFSKVLSADDQRVVNSLLDEVAKAERRFGNDAIRIARDIGVDGLSLGVQRGEFVMDGARRILDPENIEHICRRQLSPAESARLGSIFGERTKGSISKEQIGPLWSRFVRMSDRAADFCGLILEKHTGKALITAGVVSYLLFPEIWNKSMESGLKWGIETGVEIIGRLIQTVVEEICSRIPADFSKHPLYATLTWAVIATAVLIIVRLSWMWAVFFLIPPSRSAGGSQVMPWNPPGFPPLH